MRGTFRRMIPSAILWLIVLTVIANRHVAAGQEPQIPVLPALMQEGEAIFSRDCLTCHAADGGEDMGPALSRNSVVGVKDEAIRRVLVGKKDMQGFAKNLTDREVAAVVTYIRNTWENALGAVLEADVARVRKEVTGKP